MAGMSAPGTAQTLSRGLRALEVLCAVGEPMRVNEVAEELGVHRSVAYRLLRTLEEHALATRSEHGYLPGPALRTLLEQAEAPQQRKATPILQGVVDDLGVTAFLAVAEHGLCVTRASVEPRGDGVRLVQRPGTAHPLPLGAPGLAVLVSLSDTVSEAELAVLAGGRTAEVRAARARGWAVSHDEVIPGVRSVAVPVRGAVGWPAALAVVYGGEPFSDEAVARRLQQAARDFALAVHR